MGQKVDPNGLRTGVIKSWSSKWYADKAHFADNIVEDNVFENESLGYGAICVDGVFNETTKAYLESKNKNCVVVQLVE